MVKVRVNSIVIKLVLLLQLWLIYDVAATYANPYAKVKTQCSSGGQGGSVCGQTCNLASGNLDDMFLKVIAGNGLTTYSGDGGSATDAAFKSMTSIWTDSNGNTYIVDKKDNRVRVVESATGVVNTVCGNGNQIYNSAGGVATNVPLFSPTGCIGDDANNILYISDKYHVWKLDTLSGMVTRYAGGTVQLTSSSGNGGQATNAFLNGCAGMWLTTDGVLYVAEQGAGRVRTIDTNGIINTAAGSGLGFGGDGDTALSPNVLFSSPCGCYVDPTSGALYIADQFNGRVRIVANSIVNTMAGGGNLLTEGIAATQFALSTVTDVRGDSHGNIYLCDGGLNKIFRVDASGTITSFMGNGNFAVSLGTSTVTSPLAEPSSIWIDNVNCAMYTAESAGAILKVSDCGCGESHKPQQPEVHCSSSSSSSSSSLGDVFLQVIAGTGVANFSGDGQVATKASFQSTFSVWVDEHGNSYVVDSMDARVRLIAKDTGIVTTIMGTGEQTFTATGSAGTSTSLYFPWGCVGDDTNNVLYVSDRYHIWKHDMQTGQCTRFAGGTTQTSQSTGDGGQAINARLNAAAGMWLHEDGTLYIAESGAAKIRAIASSGIISTVAGSGNVGFGGDGDSCKAPTVKMSSPCGCYVDTNGVLYIADQFNARVRIVANGIISTYAGGGDGIPDNEHRQLAQLGNVGDVRGDAYGNIFVSDITSNMIYRIDGQTNLIVKMIGSGNAGITTGISCASSSISAPLGLWLDSTKNILYHTESTGCLVKQSSSLPVMPVCNVTVNTYTDVVAGSGSSGYYGDGSFAVDAQFKATTSVWTDADGNSYIVDNEDARVRFVAKSTNLITTVVGTGHNVYSSSGTWGVDTPLVNPWGCVGDDEGSLFVSDKYHIWKYNITSGKCSKYAGGSQQILQSLGDNNLAINAYLNASAGMWLHADGTLYIAESGAAKIRAIASSGIITTVAGSGNVGFGGDGGSCTASTVKMNTPCGCYVNNNNMLFIADQLNARVRVVTNGIITTYAGGGSQTVDGCLATSFKLGSVGDVRGDVHGHVYITDMTNHILFKVDASTKIITKFVGTGSSGVSLGASCANSALTAPCGLWIDKVTNLVHFTELGGCTVKKCQPVVHPTGSPAGCPTCGGGGPGAVVTRSPSVSPSVKPSFKPSAKPSVVVTRSPTLSPNRHKNTFIQIKGKLFLSHCGCSSNSSLSIFLEAILNISANPQSCKLLSAEFEGILKIFHMKNLLSLTSSSSSSDNYQLDFMNLYYMIFYPGHNASSISSQKQQQIRNAIEDGTFVNVLRHLAKVNNVPELQNVTCEGVELTATIITPDGETDSTSSKPKLSSGAIAGITIGAFVGAFLLFIVVGRYVGRKSEGEEEEEYHGSEGEGEGEGEEGGEVPQNDPDAEGEGAEEGGMEMAPVQSSSEAEPVSTMV
jgi:hypothetical protein